MLKKLSWLIRWKIAYFMDRYPDTCWTRLGLWAEYPSNHEFWEIIEMRGTADGCQEDYLVDGYCYCGKLGTMPDTADKGVPRMKRLIEQHIVILRLLKNIAVVIIMSVIIGLLMSPAFR